MKLKPAPAPSPHYVPELNGLRALLVFIVSWYHIWQQSWLTPYIGSYSLDYLVRAGYTPVDGTILLSGFLLFLPHARSMVLGEKIPDTRSFYRRRVMRIVPSYYFVTVLLLFVVAIPQQKYWTTGAMVKDLLMHLTFTQTFDFSTYIATPIGVASWTIAIEMQAYLIFPLLARWARRNPLGTFGCMAAAALAFRCWCLFELTDHNMVVNQLINFLDVYAIGMAAALVYVHLTRRYPKDKRQWFWQAAATFAVFAALVLFLRVYRAQAGSAQSVIQAGQMVRRPVFALLLAVVTVALPFSVRPLRFLMGNRLMGALALISMNYYLIHQEVAKYLKVIQFPPSQYYPHPNNRYADFGLHGPDQPWADQYTALCFGISLLLAALITFLVEKPAAHLLQKLFARMDEKRRSAAEIAPEPATADETSPDPS